ncbi:MAG: M6 family metalloprotease domain-containing protein, partial [Prevotella sp.]|nr:M6 family metalloprotease domain-containing protein [Prevotella sp.]
RRQQANARRAKRLAPRKVGEVGSITGQKKGLIILVSFKEGDTQFQTTNAYFQRVVNEPNFSDGNFVGSMYDYFKAQSDGQFELTFDVVGPVTVSNAHSYYGSNDSDGNDQHAAEMVIEAVRLADSQVDYSDYDWDGNGEVEQVYVVYAGQGEADGGSANTIWPHEWELSSAAKYGDGSGAQTLDGVTIDTYACGGELNGSGNIAGIGTMCHEFSHCLGYPDFYDTDYSGGQGMFEWDLMDSGSYNDDGYRPAGYTSYERWVAGWREPIELTSTQQISNMPALVNSGAQSYIIYNQGNHNEYFLLENRQKTGWDAGIPGAGLLILHVDYDADAWSSNTPNDTPSHQRMTWIPADNQYQYTTYQGTKYYTTSGAANDPFPYGSVNAFNKSTTPAAKFYNKNSDNTYYLDSSIENITQNSNGTVSFKFVGVSNVATPTFSPKAGRYSEAQTVTISCETSGSTIYYTLDGTAPTTSSSVYSQPLTISETMTVKAIAVADGEESATATAKYTIGQSTSDPDATTFRLVSSVDDLEPGMRYIIACGSKATAAGAHNSTYLGTETVTVSNDVITIGSGVAVFVLEGDQDTGWTFQNESTDEYLYATAAKSVKYSSDEELWTLSNGNDGVVMTYGSFGTMLYNSSSPRFTTYTSSPTSSMIQANLYKEESSGTPVVADPFIMADESLNFSTTVGTPATKTFEVLTEGLTEDVTLTLSDANNVFSLGQSTIAKTVTDANISVTFNPTQAGTFTATITLTSAGAEPATVTLTGTATDGTTPVDPTGGETLLYEGVSGYSSENDGSQALTASSSNLDYDGWTDITKVYAGGTTNAHVEGEGGCLKLGTGSAIGSLTTGSLAINGNATLTFYLRQYNTDSGVLNVTVTGATADVTQFTPSSSWTQCIVNLIDGDGQVTITFATTSKRAYLDEITLITAGGDTPVQKQDIDLQFTEPMATANLDEPFTAPELIIEPSDLAVTYSSSNEQVATVDAQTGAVTLVAEGTTVITASFAGDDDYNPAEASYTLTVSSGTTPVDPTGGETLLYEGLSGYDISSDSSTALETDDDNLDYSGWDSFTKVYAGGMSNSYIQGEGGCLKLGSSKAEGSMTTGTLAIEGKATLTFYLKKYGTDSGVLNVTVTGATADVTQFTPSSSWTQCIVNLIDG